MSIHRFKYLFDQFINKTASLEESEEFLAMIRSANYDVEMQLLLDDLWSTTEPNVTVDEGVAENIFNTITSSPRNKKGIQFWNLSPVWARAAAAVLILGVAAFFYIRRPAAEQVTYVQTPVTKPVRSEIPSRRFINLPDGSSVILNANSVVNLGEKFGAKGKREVYLQGEAYFDIVHDSNRPFIVHTGAVETTVLGTAFSINSGENDKNLLVTVIRGRVKVGNAAQIFDVLEPDEQLIVDKDLGEHIKKSVDAAAVIAWKNEDLYFDEVNLQDVATELSGRFHIPIVFANDSIKKCRFSATFLKSQTLEQILNVIAEFNQIKFQLKDNKVFLDGAGCK